MHSVCEMIRRQTETMLKKLGTKPEALRELFVAGNTVMQHLYAGLDPSPIARAPFTAPTLFTDGSPETGLTLRGKKVIGHTPMQRFGQPEDLLGCVRFLLDDRAAAFVTGITVPVDGGFLSHPGI